MVLSYTQWLLERQETPPWMKKTVSSKLTGSIGTICDVVTEAMQRTVTSGLFNHPNLSSDGLDLRGGERGIPRRPGEGNPAYALRLKDAWELWRNAGSRAQLIDEIEGHLGVTGVKIIATHEWDGVTSDPYLGTYPAWSDSGELDNWSRFWIYVPHTGHSFTADGAWDSAGNWDDGGVWDFEGVTWQQVQNFWSVVNLYRSAHEIPVRARFILEAGSFTDVDTWSGASLSLDFYT